jgi:hypothetical protein
LTRKLAPEFMPMIEPSSAIESIVSASHAHADDAAPARRTKKTRSSDRGKDRPLHPAPALRLDI